MLIPPEPVIELAESFDDWRPLQKVMEGAVIDCMRNEMLHDTEHPTKLQVDAVGTQIDALVELYAAWRRAKEGEAGYEFLNLAIKGNDGREEMSWYLQYK